MTTKVQTRSGKVHFGNVVGYGRVMTDCGSRNQHQLGRAAADDAEITCASCLRSMVKREAAAR